MTMNPNNVWIVALTGLTATGIATWVVVAVARIMDELRTFSFEGMHCEE